MAMVTELIPMMLPTERSIPPFPDMMTAVMLTASIPMNEAWVKMLRILFISKTI